MKNIPAIITTSLLCLCISSCAAEKKTEEKSGADTGKAKGESTVKTAWITDFEKAKAESKKSGKPVFALFTGSDWCGWCVALHDEVFKTKEFQEYGAKELVLFEADFPRSKKISKEIRKQNQALAEKYGIQGFPTVLILDADGKKLAETGYQAGGGEKYVKHLKELVK